LFFQLKGRLIEKLWDTKLITQIWLFKVHFSESWLNWEINRLICFKFKWSRESWRRKWWILFLLQMINWGFLRWFSVLKVVWVILLQTLPFPFHPLKDFRLKTWSDNKSFIKNHGRSCVSFQRFLIKVSTTNLVYCEFSRRYWWSWRLLSFWMFLDREGWIFKIICYFYFILIGWMTEVVS